MSRMSFALPLIMQNLSESFSTQYTYTHSYTHCRGEEKLEKGFLLFHLLLELNYFEFTVEWKYLFEWHTYTFRKAKRKSEKREKQGWKKRRKTRRIEKEKNLLRKNRTNEKKNEKSIQMDWLFYLNVMYGTYELLENSKKCLYIGSQYLRHECFEYFDFSFFFHLCCFKFFLLFEKEEKKIRHFRRKK